MAVWGSTYGEPWEKLLQARHEAQNRLSGLDHAASDFLAECTHFPIGPFTITQQGYESIMILFKIPSEPGKAIYREYKTEWLETADVEQVVKDLMEWSQDVTRYSAGNGDESPAEPLG